MAGAKVEGNHGGGKAQRRKESPLLASGDATHHYCYQSIDLSPGYISRRHNNGGDGDEPISQAITSEVDDMRVRGRRRERRGVGRLADLGNGYN
jgi:hypothetical protein